MRTRYSYDRSKTVGATKKGAVRPGTPVIELHPGPGDDLELVYGHYDDAGFQGALLATIKPFRLQGQNKRAFENWLDFVRRNAGKVRVPRYDLTAGDRTED